MNQKLKLNLGCGKDVREGFDNYDNRSSGRGHGFVDPRIKFCDLNTFPWPFQDDYADEILMWHVLEHLPDTYRAMAEVKRILKPGGKFWGQVPYAFSHAAMNHAQHMRYFTKYSFGHISEDFDMPLARSDYSNNSGTWFYRVRNMLPCKFYLSFFLNNIHDNVNFELIKKQQ